MLALLTRSSAVLMPTPCVLWIAATRICHHQGYPSMLWVPSPSFCTGSRCHQGINCGKIMLAKKVGIWERQELPSYVHQWLEDFSRPFLTPTDVWTWARTPYICSLWMDSGTEALPRVTFYSPPWVNKEHLNPAQFQSRKPLLVTSAWDIKGDFLILVHSLLSICHILTTFHRATVHDGGDRWTQCVAAWKGHWTRGSEVKMSKLNEENVDLVPW